MILANLKLLNSVQPVDICCIDGIITGIEPPGNVGDDIGIQFPAAIAFPGLINSHDHLDFNCFPALGNCIYNNYTEWGTHIHTGYKNEIEAVLKIPLAIRVKWGMYKNMLSGVTTVVNHGDVLPIEDPFITVLQDSQNLHSVGFEKNWKRKLNNVFAKTSTTVMHVGEGTDEIASKEIDELIRWNIFNKDIVAVHGVAMASEQADKFKGLVWCPVSNEFLLNKTAGIDKLKQHTKVVFGTDSTLTGDWDIWEHIRMARKTGLVTDAELFDMLNTSPADLWNIKTGRLAVGKQADIVICRCDVEIATWNTFYDLSPADILMVVQQGKIIMYDESVLPQLNKADFDHTKFQPVMIGRTMKFVYGDIIKLVKDIQYYYPQASFPFTIPEYEKTVSLA